MNQLCNGVSVVIHILEKQLSGEMKILQPLSIYLCPSHIHNMKKLRASCKSTSIFLPLNAMQESFPVMCRYIHIYGLQSRKKKVQKVSIFHPHSPCLTLYLSSFFPFLGLLLCLTVHHKLRASPYSDFVARKRARYRGKEARFRSSRCINNQLRVRGKNASV